MSKRAAQIVDPRDRYMAIPPPSRRLIWGSGLMLASLLLVLSLAAFIDYPLTLTQDIVVISDAVPVQIFARSEGVLRNWKLHDGDTVTRGSVVGYIYGDVALEDIERLEQTITVAERALRDGSDYEPEGIVPGEYFGEMQGDVRSLYERWEERNRYRSTLERVDRERLQRLSAGGPGDGSREVFELERRLLENEGRYEEGVRGVITTLRAKIETWKSLHLIRIPADGVVSLGSVWAELQTIRQGDEILAIMRPSSHFIGKAVLTQEDVLAVAVGDSVSIALPPYSDAGYGVLAGRIASISPLPRDGRYNVDVRLDDSLRSSGGKRIPYKPWMRGVLSLPGARRKSILGLIPWFDRASAADTGKPGTKGER
jgi:hypothetical protein